MKIISKKVMPCGYKRTGKFKEHRAHYEQCNHPACKARIAAWEALKTQIKASGGIKIEIESLEE